MKLKVGQAIIYKGSIGTVREIGPKQTTEGRTFRWIKVDTHRGIEECTSDHPKLVVLTY